MKLITNRLRQVWGRLAMAGHQLHESETELSLNIISNKILVIFIFLLGLCIVINAILALIYSSNTGIFYWMLTYLVAGVLLLVAFITTYQVKNSSTSRSLRISSMLFSYFLGSLYFLAIVTRLGKEYGGIIHIYTLLPIPFFILNIRDKKTLTVTLILFIMLFIAAFYLVYIHEKPLFLPSELRRIVFIIINVIEFTGLGGSIYFFWKQTLVTEARLENLASYDPMTGLLNRRAFARQLLAEISRMKRYQLKSAILLLDIDHFKKINDTYGHAVGDTIIKEFAQILLENTRESDLVSRWGGEEFIILFTNLEKNGAFDAAEKIRKVVESHTFTRGIQLTTSGGLAVVNSEGSLDRHIKKIDDLLYEAKNSGRNRLAYSTEIID